MNKKLIKVLATSCTVISITGGVMVGAATRSPWAQKTEHWFSNEVETTFTAEWRTTSDDSKYNVLPDRYIKNSWCKVTEGDRKDYHISADYYYPDTTWVHTTASLSDSPFHTASMSYGWGYQ